MIDSPRRLITWSRQFVYHICPRGGGRRRSFSSVSTRDVISHLPPHKGADNVFAQHKWLTTTTGITSPVKIHEIQTEACSRPPVYEFAYLRALLWRRRRDDDHQHWPKTDSNVFQSRRPTRNYHKLAIPRRHGTRRDSERCSGSMLAVEKRAVEKLDNELVGGGRTEEWKPLWWWRGGKQGRVGTTRWRRFTTAQCL